MKIEKIRKKDEKKINKILKELKLFKNIWIQNNFVLFVFFIFFNNKFIKLKIIDIKNKKWNYS